MNTLTKFRIGMAQSLKQTAVHAICIVVLSLVASSLAFSGNLDDIKKRGYMVVATEDDYPPFKAVVNGKPFGYDHALLDLLKKQAGFDIRQEILPWQGILPGVASGKYDAAVTAAVITDERAKSLDFTVPIAESTMAYVKRTGDDRLKSIKDLSGMTLGVQQGGASYQALPALEATLKKTGGQLGQVVQYGNFSEAYQDLINKRLDAVVNNIVSLSTLTAQRPQQFTLGERVGDKSYAAWAVQKGNSSLLQYLNAFLAKEKADGDFKKLQAEYLKITFDDLPNEPLLPGDRKM
jgi:polar amino acid transport system substrate-binding protein